MGSWAKGRLYRRRARQNPRAEDARVEDYSGYPNCPSEEEAVGDSRLPGAWSDICRSASRASFLSHSWLVCKLRSRPVFCSVEPKTGRLENVDYVKKTKPAFARRGSAMFATASWFSFIS